MSLALIIHSYKYSHHIEPVSHSGVEKNNDDSKRHYFSSKKHDAETEIVHADMKLEILITDWHRKKRPYRKRQTEEDNQLQAKQHLLTPGAVDL